MRILIYSEGTAEAGLLWTLEGSPGRDLLDHELGPVHWLLRRLTASLSSRPNESIRFVLPNRLRSGKRPSGSELLVARKLHELIVPACYAKTVDIVVVLVDADADKDRYRKLREDLLSINVTEPRIAGVAVQEFESWLIADQNSASTCFGRTIHQSPDPESLRRREAKTLFNKWIEGQPNVLAAKIDHVRRLDLGIIEKRCDSFRRFREDLAVALRLIAPTS